MTALAATISSDIATILNTPWKLRDGQVVPRTEDVALADGGVKLEAVVLYADFFHSTTLARSLARTIAAKVIRAYLKSMARLIREHDGAVRSFDGDRVMGVFVGNSMNSSAAKCALKMNHVVLKILKPKAEAKFPSLKEKGFSIAHCVGVARSEVLVVRAGIRGDNDLVFVGSAPNIAAKLSEIRNSPWHSYITWQVYKKLTADAKYGPNREDMWTSVERKLDGEKWDLYKSKWRWEP